MREILANKKMLFTKSKIKPIKVKKFDEISIKKIYHKMLEREELKPYFPSKYATGRQCQKEYFWNICNTIFPDETSELIMNANN